MGEQFQFECPILAPYFGGGRRQRNANTIDGRRQNKPISCAFLRVCSSPVFRDGLLACVHRLQGCVVHSIPKGFQGCALRHSLRLLFLDPNPRSADVHLDPCNATLALEHEKGPNLSLTWGRETLLHRNAQEQASKVIMHGHLRLAKVHFPNDS